MTIRVLIVDDSNFICKRIKEILEDESEFKVIGIANNGREGVRLATELAPDVITMDIEMPVMDGISAVKKIMIEKPTGILMFSAATHAGAKASLEALNAGAIDFLPKQLNEIDGDREMAKRLLRRRVRMVALQTKRIQSTVRAGGGGQVKAVTLSASIASSPVQNKSAYSCRNKKVDLLVIVASTGGPVAIQKILPKLSADCSFPILIIQHMPQNFTKSFAERLNQLSQVTVQEAINGDSLKPGVALLAPGGMQMEVNHVAGRKVIKIRDKQGSEIYSPCADITLSSIANVFSINVVTVVLTGMGADGKEGAVKLKQKGLSVWAQDEASCTIYGMPKAIVDANLADNTFNLDEISYEFSKLS